MPKQLLILPMLFTALTLFLSCAGSRKIESSPSTPEITIWVKSPMPQLGEWISAGQIIRDPLKLPSTELKASISGSLGSALEGSPIWTTDPSGIVEIIPSSGIQITLTALAEGTCTLTVSVGGLSKTATVTVQRFGYGGTLHIQD